MLKDKFKSAYFYYIPYSDGNSLIFGRTQVAGNLRGTVHGS